MNEYALITGASRGIGKSMAILLAARGYNLLLTARSESELKELSADIQSQYQVNVLYFAADLSAVEAASKIKTWCTDHNVTDISVLINNAGYGLWGNFEKLDIKEQMNMLQLNINAVVELTYLLLPVLKKQKKAYILNVASTAAYLAMPTLALYAASKTFILSYSRALTAELKNTSVSVSCLCPGPTDTGFATRAGMDVLAELADKFNMPADLVAATGLKGMFNKKTEIIPGFLNKLSYFGAKHLPKSLIERVTARLYKS